MVKVKKKGSSEKRAARSILPMKEREGGAPRLEELFNAGLHHTPRGKKKVSAYRGIERRRGTGRAASSSDRGEKEAKLPFNTDGGRL